MKRAFTKKPVKNLKECIASLNTGQAGSFGEHLYYSIKKSEESIIESRRSRSELTDFIVDGRRVDVKSSRTKIHLADANCFFPKTAPGVDCVSVTFLSNKVKLCSINGWKREFNYLEIKPFWSDWLSNKIPRSNNSSVKNDRFLKKKFLKEQVETALQVKVYFVFRGMEILSPSEATKFSHSGENPDNIAYRCIKKGEELILYLRFKRNSTDYHDGACIRVADLKKAEDAAIKSGAKPSPDYRFDKPPFLPLQYSWGKEICKNSLMVSIEHIRRNQARYPSVLFNSTTFEVFKKQIKRWFSGKS